MIFETGDLIVLGILTILLFVFRQFDRNNRSLEKVRSYADKVRAQLDEIVQEKRDAIRDLSIDMDIQEKTDKEILKRVEAARGEMISHAESIDNFNEKVTVYNERVEQLVTMTAQVDENLLRIHEESEYVDTVGKRISESLRKIQLLEKAMGALQEEFVKQNKANLDQFQDSLLQSSEKRIRSVEEQVEQSELQVKHFRETVEELDQRHESLAEEKIALFEKDLDVVRENYNGYLAEIADKGLKLEAEVFDELNESINSRSDRIEENWKSGINELKDSIASTVEDIKSRISTVEEGMTILEDDSSAAIDRLNSALVQAETDQRDRLEEKSVHLSSLIENFENETSERMEVLTGRFAEHESLMMKESEDILDRSRLLIKEHEEDSSSLLEKIKENMKEVTDFSGKIGEQIDAFKGQIDSETKGLEEKLESITRHMESDIDAKAAELETGLMKSVEEKVGEYEQAISRRFDRLDGFMEDLDNLENNLKISLQEAVSSVERDFELFNENLTEERSVFRNSLISDGEELRGKMEELEQGLEALKSRAYDNVSEKLKVFEDEFFSDLKKRDTAMQGSLEEWQKGIDFKMEEVDLKGSREREELQQFWTSDVKMKLSELQSNMYGQFEQFKDQVQDFRDRIDSSINNTEEEMKNFSESVKEDISQLKDDSGSYFEGQFSEFKTGIAERFDKADKTIELKFEEMMSDLDISRQGYVASIDKNKADLLSWQQQLEKQMKENETDLADQVLNFKTDVTENISLIRDDFRNQREELIVSTNEERANLKREINENSSRLDELNKEMERNSQLALDQFRSDYDDFILDFQRKSHDIQSETDNHSREVRQGLSDTREKVDALQKKMFGRIEEDYNLLNSNLKEIESKQQDFVAQTKIFERADSLKEALSTDIDALKDQVAHIEKRSGEAFRIKDEYAEILKLNEEIQVKLANVMSEKQKIDTMDERINKIINLSDSVNLKLDEISSTHDILQEYQVRLRQIEDLQDSIDKRYQRLDKKSAVIDTTTEGVDKNFQLMETIEKALNTVRGDLTPLFNSLKEAKEQHSVIQEEQDKIRSVVEKLSSIDDSIAELDKRIESMNKAREWVASTESRMDSIGKKAREQVQLFGKLMEKDGQTVAAPARRKGTPGSPDMEIREMVLRLAHEGWKSEEIARTTKLSQGEVELILELSPEFNRK